MTKSEAIEKALHDMARSQGSVLEMLGEVWDMAVEQTKQEIADEGRIARNAEFEIK